MAHPHVSTLATVVKVILHHLDTKYIRVRRNGPRQSLILLLSVIQSGVDRIGVKAAKLVVMDQMSRVLKWNNGAVPSVSAIARALHKLKPAHLESVIAVGLEAVTKAFGPHLLQHGYRLVAIDGVRMNTQRTTVLARLFGRPKYERTKKAHQPQALVVIARCVRTGVILAQEVVGHKGSERACARKMCNKLAKMGRILVLFDRGFPSRVLIGQLHEIGIKYLVRMCGGKSTWSEIQEHTSDGKAKDIRINVRLKKGNGTSYHDFVRAIITGKGKPGRPRSDRKQQRMILFTNLTGKYWSTQRLVAMYFRRWDIETSFREDKRLLGSTNSRAKTKNAFTNELLSLHIYRIIMAIIAAITVKKTGMPTWENDRAERLVTTQLIVTAWVIIEMAITSPPQGVDKMTDFIREIIRDSQKKRPGRSAKRICKGREGVWKHKDEKSHY